MERYVEKRKDGSFYVAGLRIPLACVALAFRDGESPECIQNHYPAMSLEQVYGAITFCLARPAEVDAYLRQLSRAPRRAGSRTLPRTMVARLNAARKRRERAAGADAADAGF